MHHQFLELADVDITKQPMEVGPTCHYVMGGVEVDADSTVSAVPGLFAAGEVSGGMHGSNRLGGNSLSDLLVFGKRAGEHAAAHADEATAAKVPDTRIEEAVSTALAPLELGAGGENPYTLQHELQEVMGSLVGLIRTRKELEESLVKLTNLKERVGKVGVSGGRRYNPGWHLALDLRNMLIVSEATAKAALEREESRGGHTRDDFPKMSAEWRKIHLICSFENGGIKLTRKDNPKIRPDLLRLFDRAELTKYLTEEELAEYDAIAGQGSEN
jgi:succinate dehydrogenase / fumarate reductase flavoprotein subunit